MMTWILAVLLAACAILGYALRSAYKQLDRLGELYEAETQPMEPVMVQSLTEAEWMEIESKFNAEDIIEEVKKL